jgi:hypothetical protein
MLLPYQRFLLHTLLTPKELKRQVALMSSQLYSTGSTASLFRKKREAGSPACLCTLEGQDLTVTGLKPGGEEDIVKISGQLGEGQGRLIIKVQLLPTTAGFVSLARGVVLALVAGYLYLTLGSRLLGFASSNDVVIWLMLIAFAVWFQLRQFSLRAGILMELMIHWLELEEENTPTTE